jgi:peptidyl-prolyl cis-trans isomerase-like 4
MKHNQKGLLVTSNKGPNMNESSFFITLSDEHRQYLDGKHTIFGKVVEGHSVLDSINEAFLMNRDGTEIEDIGEPYQAIKIKHILIIDDPFPNPDGLRTPSRSPSPAKNLDEDENAKFVDDNIDLKELLDLAEGGTQEKVSKSRAHVLEILGDLPDAEIEPPKNVLFVCQLNPVTQESDLESIFSRFGEIKS